MDKCLGHLGGAILCNCSVTANMSYKLNCIILSLKIIKLDIWNITIGVDKRVLEVNYD